jgi:hypothetical protein
VDAVGAARRTALLRTAKSCGPDAPTLAFKLAQETAPATVTNKPDHRESAKETVKPLRGECRVFPA